MSDFTISRGGRRVTEGGPNAAKIAVIIAAVVVVILIGLTVWVSAYDNILPGVHVGTVDVGGLSTTEAEARIASELHTGVHTLRITWQQDSSVDVGVGADVDAKAAAEAAHKVGRDGGIFGKVGAFFGEKEAEYAPEFNRAEINSKLDEIEDTINTDEVPFRTEIRGSELCFYVGSPARKLDRAAAQGAVDTALAGSAVGETTMVDISGYVSETPVALPDVDTLFNSIHAGSSEAHYVYTLDEKTGKKVVDVAPSTVGYTFDRAEAQRLLSQGGDFIIPVVETQPDTSDSELTDALFRDLIADSKTTLNKYNYNRTGNVKLAADAINGTVLEPGEEFSYNDVVGQRTYERGYREASVYVSSGIEDQLGGGICQVSSTLYMSVIRTRLEVVNRANHAYTVAYTPLGEDATVYWGYTDFKFSNNREYPVKIVAWQEDDYVQVQIWGTDVDGYTVEIELETHSSNPYATIKRDNAALDYGKTKQVVEGHSGYSVTTYAIIKDKDGKQVDRYKLASSRYKRLDRVLDVGTLGAPAAAVTPEVPVVAPSTVPAETDAPVQSAPPAESAAPSAVPAETPAPPVATPAPTEEPLDTASREP